MIYDYMSKYTKSLIDFLLLFITHNQEYIIYYSLISLSLKYYTINYKYKS